MDEGLIQVLVIAFFIIVSMMDGAARKRRKNAQRAGAKGTSPPDGDFGDVGRSSGPMASASGGLAEVSGGVTQASGRTVTSSREAARPSEGMVPEDLWQEIAALARGETTAPSRGASHAPVRTSKPARGPDADADAWTAARQEILRPQVPDLEGGERASRALERYAPDAPTPTGRPTATPTKAPTKAPVSLRATPRELVSSAPELPAGVRAEPRRAERPGGVRSVLRGGAKRSLRQAIVLAEVLNVPLALRDSGGERERLGEG